MASDLGELTPDYVHLILHGWHFSFRRRRIVGDRFEDGPIFSLLQHPRAFAHAAAKSPVLSVEITLWPWPPSGHRPKEEIKRLWLNLGLRLLARTARSQKKPVIVFDLHDLPVILHPRLLACADRYYKRELPLNRHDLFLNASGRPDGYLPFEPFASKIQPISLGLTDYFFTEAAKTSPQPKRFDVFWSGDEHISTMRQEGRRELEALRGAGRAIFFADRRLDRAEFYQAMSQSRLAWAPEGRGWYTYRQFEALLCGAVPIISTPKVKQEHPFVSGDHCFIYGPERGGLSSCITSALAKSDDELQKITHQGKAFVERHHRLERIQRRCLFG